MEEKNMAEPLRDNEPLSDTRRTQSADERWTESVDGANNPNAIPRIRSVPAGLLPEDSPSRPLGEWPHDDITEAAAPESDRRVRSAGEAVGNAIGIAVSQAKDIPGRLQGGMEHLKRRFRVITGGGSAGSQLSSELAGQAGDGASDAAREAQRRLRYWESRARHYAREYPLQFIAVAAASGFALGFLLRLGRDE